MTLPWAVQRVALRPRESAPDRLAPRLAGSRAATRRSNDILPRPSRQSQPHQARISIGSLPTPSAFGRIQDWRNLNRDPAPQHWQPRLRSFDESPQRPVAKVPGRERFVRDVTTGADGAPPALVGESPARIGRAVPTSPRRACAPGTAASTERRQVGLASLFAVSTCLGAHADPYVCRAQAFLTSNAPATRHRP